MFRSFANTAILYVFDPDWSATQSGLVGKDLSESKGPDSVSQEKLEIQIDIDKRQHGICIELRIILNPII